MEPAPVVSGTRIKGIVFTSRREFVTNRWGAAGWDRVLASLGTESRRTLQGRLLGTSFYPLQLNDEVDRAICTALASGDVRIYREMGEYSANLHIPMSYAGPVSSKDPVAFLRAAASNAPKYYDAGTGEVEVRGPCYGILRLQGFQSTQTNCETNLGFFARGLELCGAIRVRPNEPVCSARGGWKDEYEFRWDPPPKAA